MTCNTRFWNVCETLMIFQSQCETTPIHRFCGTRQPQLLPLLICLLIWMTHHQSAGHRLSSVSTQQVTGLSSVSRPLAYHQSAGHWLIISQQVTGLSSVSTQQATGLSSVSRSSASMDRRASGWHWTILYFPFTMTSIRASASSSYLGLKRFTN